MEIIVNGKKSTCREGITILEYLKDKGLNPAGVVVECNEKIITPETFEHTRLCAEDRLEILHFVGGG